MIVFHFVIIRLELELLENLYNFITCGKKLKDMMCLLQKIELKRRNMPYILVAREYIKIVIY